MKNKVFLLLTSIFVLVGLGAAASPDITGTTLNPLYPADGETVTLDLSATDDTGITEIGYVSIAPDGTQADSGSGSFSSPYPTSYDTATDGGSFSTTPQQTGDYTIEFYVTDDEGNNVSVFRTMEVTDTGGEPTPSFTISDPIDGEIFTYPSGDSGANVDFAGTIDTQSSGTVELFIDFKDGNGYTSYYSEAISGTGSESFSTTELISDTGGNYPDAVWRFTSDETGTTYNSPVKSFTVEESDASPTVDSISTTPTNPQVGDNTDVSFTASDDNGITSFDIVVTDPSGTQVNSVSATTSNDPTSLSETYADFFNPSTSGDYQVEVTVTDTNSQTSSDTLTVSVSSESSPTFNLEDPANGATYTYAPDKSSTSVNYDGTVDTSFSGTLRIYRNSVEVYSQSVSDGSNSYSFTESLSKNNYTYYVEVTSSATNTDYTSTSRDFTVNQADETPPAITTSSPSSGETLFFGEGDTSTNATFDGEVSADYTGSINVTLNGNTIKEINHTSGTTDVTAYNNLVEGNYTWNIVFQSNDTGDAYSGNQRSFSVAQTNETPPALEIGEPSGILNSSFLVDPISYSGNVSADWNGTVTYSVEYPNGFTQQVDQKDFTNGSQLTVSGDFKLFENEKEPGTYTARLFAVSDETGNQYQVSQNFAIDASPHFESVRPDNTTVVLEGLQNFHNTLFQAELEFVSPGTVRYQVREEGNRDWNTIETLQVNSFQEEVNLDFYEVVQDIEFIGTKDGRRYSGNYTGRVTYLQSNTSSTYSSSFTTFNYIEPEAEGLQRVRQILLDMFGEGGVVISSVFIVILMIGWLAFIIPDEGGTFAGLAGGLAATIGLTATNFLPPFIGLILSLGIAAIIAKWVSSVNE